MSRAFGKLPGGAAFLMPDDRYAVNHQAIIDDDKIHRFYKKVNNCVV